MTYRTKRHYRDFRAAGYRASLALRHARTLIEFDDAGDDVRITIAPEGGEEDYFDFYDRPECRADYKWIVKSIDRHGLWLVTGEYRCPGCGEWQVADSEGGVFDEAPDCPFSNVHVPLLMRAALNARAAGFSFAACLPEIDGKTTASI